ncbi:hypothetical protein CRG98_026767 [Punica granatum]|uniref:Uncharacterized protein n=1 Tax=Punica granatum TaxID=22663 RepID=A0A2I0J9B0_PUNGR|nr:hypothetical protein CRG98_026767 [Punica granatum]
MEDTRLLTDPRGQERLSTNPTKPGKTLGCLPIQPLPLHSATRQKKTVRRGSRRPEPPHRRNKRGHVARGHPRSRGVEVWTAKDLLEGRGCTAEGEGGPPLYAPQQNQKEDEEAHNHQGCRRPPSAN